MPSACAILVTLSPATTATAMRWRRAARLVDGDFAIKGIHPDIASGTQSSEGAVGGGLGASGITNQRPRRASPPRLQGRKCRLLSPVPAEAAVTEGALACGSRAPAIARRTCLIEEWASALARRRV